MAVTPAPATPPSKLKDRAMVIGLVLAIVAFFAVVITGEITGAISFNGSGSVPTPSWWTADKPCQIQDGPLGQYVLCYHGNGTAYTP